MPITKEHIAEWLLSDQYVSEEDKIRLRANSPFSEGRVAHIAQPGDSHRSFIMDHNAPRWDISVQKEHASAFYVALGTFLHAAGIKMLEPMEILAREREYSKREREAERAGETLPPENILRPGEMILAQWQSENVTERTTHLPVQVVFHTADVAHIMDVAQQISGNPQLPLPMPAELQRDKYVIAYETNSGHDNAIMYKNLLKIDAEVPAEDITLRTAQEIQIIPYVCYGKKAVIAVMESNEGIRELMNKIAVDDGLADINFVVLCRNAAGNEEKYKGDSNLNNVRFVADMPAIKAMDNIKNALGLLPGSMVDYGEIKPKAGLGGVELS